MVLVVIKNLIRICANIASHYDIHTTSTKIKENATMGIRYCSNTVEINDSLICILENTPPIYRGMYANDAARTLKYLFIFFVSSSLSKQQRSLKKKPSTLGTRINLQKHITLGTCTVHKKSTYKIATIQLIEVHPQARAWF